MACRLDEALSRNSMQTVRKLGVMKPPVVLLVRGASTAEMFGFPATSG